MNTLWRIGGVVVVIIAVVGFVFGQVNANAYNDYIERVRPHIAEQDKLIEDLKTTSVADAPGKYPAYVDRATALQKSFADTTPDDEELKKVHQHLINRADSLAAYCTGMNAAYQANDQAAARAALEHVKAAGEHLDAFVAARNAYGKAHNINFEDE